MKKIKFFLPLFSMLSLLLIFGCSSTQKEYEKINSDDEQKLISFAVTAIRAMPDAKITPDEKTAVLKTKPAMSVIYTGNKTGRYGITWDINKKTITCTGNGDITLPKSSFSKINIISVDTP